MQIPESDYQIPKDAKTVLSHSVKNHTRHEKKLSHKNKGVKNFDSFIFSGENRTDEIADKTRASRIDEKIIDDGIGPQQENMISRCGPFCKRFRGFIRFFVREGKGAAMLRAGPTPFG